MRRAGHDGLVGYHHHSQRPIEHLRLHRRQMTLEDGLIIGREEILRTPPRAVAFDHRIDGDVADPDLPHIYSPELLEASVTGGQPPFKAFWSGGI